MEPATLQGVFPDISLLVLNALLNINQSPTALPFTSVSSVHLIVNISWRQGLSPVINVPVVQCLIWRCLCSSSTVRSHGFESETVCCCFRNTVLVCWAFVLTHRPAFIGVISQYHVQTQFCWRIVIAWSKKISCRLDCTSVGNSWLPKIHVLQLLRVPLNPRRAVWGLEERLHRASEEWIKRCNSSQWWYERDRGTFTCSRPVSPDWCYYENQQVQDQDQQIW